MKEKQTRQQNRQVSGLISLGIDQITETDEVTFNKQKVFFTEAETKELIKEVDLSIFQRLSVSEGLKLLRETEQDKSYAIINFNKDFKPDSYNNKLLFKELFFLDDLRSFSLRKAKDVISRNDVVISGLVKKGVGLPNKQKVLCVKRIEGLKRANEQVVLLLKRKLNYYVKQAEKHKINREGFIMGLPNQETTQATISERLQDSIKGFNAWNSLNLR